MKQFLVLTLLFGTLLMAEFPIGVYSLDPDNDYNHEVTGEFDINYVHRYVHPYKGPDQVEVIMKNAQKHGKKVLFNLIRGTVLDEEDGMEQILAVIRKYKDHPALGMWYLYDEPTGEAMRVKLSKVYEMLKQESPDIPVALCLAWTADYPIFKDCADFLMPDFYPLKNQEFPNAPLGLFPHFVWNMSRLGKPIIPIAQIMSWRSYPKVVERKNIDPASCLFPGPKEMHYFNFSTIVMDIKGMFYYSYHDLWREKQIPYFKEKIGPAIKEFAEFIKEIEGAEFKALTTPIGKGRFPEYLAASWTKDNEAWLVLVNNKGEELTGNFKLEKAPGIIGTLKTWKNTRETAAKITENSIELEKILPWEVMVWKIEP